MSETTFRFRQFSIAQEKSAMKVSTDAVLLGSYVQPENASTILDIGTGTGVVAIMLAQRSTARIDAIDIDLDSAEQARENSDTTPWANRIHVIHSSLQHFAVSTVKKYDLIVSNPPYFEHSKAQRIDAKMKAKHTNTLSYNDLIKGVKNLISDKGTFCAILPSAEGSTFESMAYVSGLFCQEKLHVFTKQGKPEKRVIMKFKTTHGFCEESNLIMQDEDLKFTKEYIEFTSDFYPPQQHKNK